MEFKSTKRAGKHLGINNNSIKSLTSPSVWLFMLYVICELHCGYGTPVPAPNPKSLADPQLLFQELPRSSQQFTMYRQLSQQLQYPPNAFQRQYPQGVIISGSGQPLIPISHFSYNITHPPRRPGIVLTHHQLQHLSHQQYPVRHQQPQQLPFALQSQQRPAYAPVIIGNPNAINAINQQPLSVIQNSSDNAIAQLQVPLQDYKERDPEDPGIGFRILNQKKNLGGPPGSASRIVFDQERPNQQNLNRALQYPQQILFGNGQVSTNELGPLPPARPYVPLQFNPDNVSATDSPVIQVPYVTTLSPLQDLIQKKKSQYQTGFRSLLASANPGLQASIQSTINRNNQLISSVRSGRVQNIVVPNFGQTPANTQLLRNPGSQQQPGLTNFNIPSNVFSNVGSQTSFPSPGSQGSFSNQLSLNFLRGTAITPENQSNLGQLLFTNPNDPNNQNSNTNTNTASSAQKIFILPPETASNTGLNQNNSDDPAEIVVTVVDESSGSEFSLEDASKDSNIQERGKVLTNFSLFLLPSTYKRCFEGYRKAHDGKCRLIIKLKSRNRG